MCKSKQRQALRLEHLVPAEPGPAEPTAREPEQGRFPSSLEPTNQSTDPGVQGSQRCLTRQWRHFSGGFKIGRHPGPQC